MKEKYNKKDLRIFSLILTFILALFSIKFCNSNNIFAGGVFLALSLTTFLIGVSLPALIIPIYETVSFIGSIIGLFITNLFLSIIFYCVFTPIGVILRIIKTDILGLRIEKNRSSYWVERKDRTVEPESLERQF